MTLPKKEKFRSIESFKEQIINDYFIAKEKNVSHISRKYNGPYSTIRRFIDEQKRIRHEEDIDDEEYFNIEDFDFLDIGYTFQWTDATKIWKVVGTTIKESEAVFMLVPSKEKGIRHFICREEEVLK